MPYKKSFGKILAAFKPGCRSDRPDDWHALQKGILQKEIMDTIYEWSFRTDNNHAYSVIGNNLFYSGKIFRINIKVCSFRHSTCIAGSNENPVNFLTLSKLPCKSMLYATGPKNKKIHLVINKEIQM